MRSSFQARTDGDDVIMYVREVSSYQVRSFSMKTGELSKEPAFPNSFSAHGYARCVHGTEVFAAEETLGEENGALIRDGTTGKTTVVPHFRVGDNLSVAIADTEQGCLALLPNTGVDDQIDIINSATGTKETIKGPHLQAYAAKQCRDNVLLARADRTRNADGTNVANTTTLQLFDIAYPKDPLASVQYKGRIEHMVIPKQDVVITSGKSGNEMATAIFWDIKDELVPDALSAAR